MCSQVLDELEVSHIPVVTAWNKVDACANPELVKSVAATQENALCISAMQSEGLEELMQLLEQKVQEMMVPVEVLLPYTQVHLCKQIQSTQL